MQPYYHLMAAITVLWGASLWETDAPDGRCRETQTQKAAALEAQDSPNL